MCTTQIASPQVLILAHIPRAVASCPTEEIVFVLSILASLLKLYCKFTSRALLGIYCGFWHMHHSALESYYKGVHQILLKDYNFVSFCWGAHLSVSCQICTGFMRQAHRSREAALLEHG